VEYDPLVTMEANIAQEPTKKPQRNSRCFCTNPKCENAREQCIAHLPPGHPWRRGEHGNGLFLLRFRGDPNDARIIALRQSVKHHLKISDEDAELETWPLAYHHWSEGVISGKVCQEITIHQMRTEGKNSLQSCKDSIMIRRQEMDQAFERCCPKTVKVRDATKRRAVTFIIEKTCNAYHGCVTKLAKEMLTTRGGDHYVPNCLRVHLRSISEPVDPSDNNGTKRGKAKGKKRKRGV
jgi:hypothetical protein